MMRDHLALADAVLRARRYQHAGLSTCYPSQRRKKVLIATVQRRGVKTVNGPKGPTCKEPKFVFSAGQVLYLYCFLDFVVHQGDRHGIRELSMGNGNSDREQL